MTIRPGDAWGSRIERPAGLVTASSDAEFVQLALGVDRPPVRLVGGDLARTLGIAAGDVDRDGSVLQLPVDIVEVTTDDGDFVACAHVVVETAGAAWRLVVRAARGGDERPIRR